MKLYQILFLILPALLVCLPIQNSWSQSVEDSDWNRPDLFEEGHKAFKAQDFVTALKDLYAFRLLNQKELDGARSQSEKALRDDLDNAIQVSDKTIRDIIKTAGIIDQEIRKLGKEVSPNDIPTG